MAFHAFKYLSEAYLSPTMWHLAVTDEAEYADKLGRRDLLRVHRSRSWHVVSYLVKLHPSIDPGSRKACRCVSAIGNLPARPL